MVADPLGAAGAFALTLALHSVVLCAVAVVVARFARAAATRELVWRFALLAPVLTAFVQSAGRAAPVEEEIAATAVVAPGAFTAPVAPLPRPAAEPAAQREPALSLAVALAAIAAAGGCGLLRLLVGGRRFRRLLATRRPLRDGAWHEAVARLAAGRRVRLSISERIASPLAFGVLRGEICLPARALGELHGEQRDAVLAHELAHLRRGDPLWSLVAHAAVAALPWQPLLHLARRELRECAELACDEAAARASGPRQTAAALLAVGEWLVRPAPPVPAAAATMARSTAGLTRRVERLLDGARAERPRRWLVAPVLAAAAAVTIAAAPGVAMPRAPAVRPAASPAAPASVPALVREAIAICEAECAALRREAEGLRAELAGSPDPELATLAAALDREVRSLSARCARLRAAADRVLASRATQPPPLTDSVEEPR